MIPDDEVEMCECELDWNCPLHRHLIYTPEDRLATDWSQSHP